MPIPFSIHAYRVVSFNFIVFAHNLVIVQPGALEEVGKLAESTGNQPKAAERQYVPASDKILLIDESSTTVDDGCWAWMSTFGSGQNTERDTFRTLTAWAR